MTSSVYPISSSDSMATVTVSSTCNDGISHNFVFEDNLSNLRTASFSSYLGSGEEAFILKLGESTRLPPSAVVAAAEPPYQLSLGRKYNEDGELSIFGAEKYFNGGMDEIETKIAEKSNKHQLKKEEKIDLPRPRKSSKSGTPSACSEASWNSRSALLQKDRSLNMQRQMSGKRFFSTFGCNCASKKSIDINEKIGKNSNPSNCRKIFDLREETDSPQIYVHGPIGVGQARTILAGNKPNRLEFQCGKEMGIRIDDNGNVGFKRGDCFTFPILNPVVGNLTVGKQFEDEKARTSLEVFGSPYMVKGNIGCNLNRSLPMLSSDTGRRRIEDVPVTSGGIDDEDLASESSSDLFEIESLSSKAHHPFFYPRDDMSSCTATPTRYEPSEASIEWSVVTASAANFSVGSDYDDQKNPDQKGMIRMTTTAAATKTHPSKANVAQRRQPTSLLGCKSTKAVNVVPNAHRVSEKS